MTTVIFLFAVISTALACFPQPAPSPPPPTTSPPPPPPTTSPPPPPPPTRKLPPATPSTTTKVPTTPGMVMFKLKGAWPSDQYEIKKYVNDFNHELGLYAKKQGIAFERFGKPIPEEMSGKVTVKYNLKNIVCEEVENFVGNAKKELDKFISKGFAVC